MRRILTLGAVALALLAQPATAQLAFLEQLTSNVNIQGLETSYDIPAGIAIAKGNVSISYDDMKLTAGEAEFHYDTGDIYAKDQVVIYKGDSVYKGEKIIYNTKTGQIRSDTLRSGLSPLFFETEGYESETKDVEVLEAHGAIVTTHDSANPNYRIRSEEIEIYPGERIVFRKAKVYIGKTPVFYLPYMSQPLDEDLGYFFQPGYNSRWGAFLLNRYGFYLGDHTLAQAHLDFRSGRGVAAGIDLFSLRHRDKKNYGNLNLYYIQDADTTYGFDTPGQIRARENIDSERYRIDFQHRVYLPGPKASTLYVDFDFSKLSDNFLLYDFYFSEFSTNPRPDNILNIVKRDPRGTLSVLGRFDVNDFNRTDSRLPEIALDVTTQPIMGSSAFYRGETSFAILEENRSDADDRTPNNPVSAIVNDEGFNRFHSYHEALHPLNNVGGWLNLNPRVGGGVTAYNDISGTSSSSASRGIFHAGLDASFKLSKTWDGVQNRALGLNGVRHIVQPYANYSYMRADSLGDEGVLPIDRLTPSTRLRPIDPTFFSAIDDMTDWNIARFGVRNFWQTRRDGKTMNWLGINTYFDYFIDDPEFDRNVSNLYNDIFWRPLPWLNLSIDSQIPLSDNEYNYVEVNTKVSWMPTDNFKMTFGHLYIQDHPIFIDSSQLSLGGYWRINDSWGVSARTRYEVEDSFLESQSIRIHKDLSSWTAALGYQRLGQRGPVSDDIGVVLSFTLKAFPDVSIPLDFNPTPRQD